MHPAEALDRNPMAGSALRAGLPKAARVYATLREAIIAMQLKPGARLVEKDLCDEFGVSRTPLRDAILRLAHQRLVTVVPSDATFVNKIILDEVIEGQLVRESLELRMVALAAERFEPALRSPFELVLFREADAAQRGDNAESFALDNEFHRLLCACAGFPRVWDTIHLATGQLDRVRRNAFPLQNYHLEVLDEHRAIFEALCRQDAETAVSLLRTHLEGTLNSLRILLAREPDLVALDPASAAFALLRRSEQARDTPSPDGGEGSPGRGARRSGVAQRDGETTDAAWTAEGATAVDVGLRRDRSLDDEQRRSAGPGRGAGRGARHDRHRERIQPVGVSRLCPRHRAGSARTRRGRAEVHGLRNPGSRG